MRYLPHTPKDIAAMLETVGLESVDALFRTIPKGCRRQNDMNLPEPLTEWELDAHMVALSEENLNAKRGHGENPRLTFVGAGRYEHFVPESISYLKGRSEFSTSYTPYQPEMSQGTLQAICEYQTLTARLL